MTSSSEQSPWGAWLRHGEGVLLVATALACLAFQLRVPGASVAAGDYEAVVEVLRREGRPGDAVVLFPWWTERARLFVPQDIPVVGYWGSESDSLREHPRLWLLAQPRLPRAELSAFMERFGSGRAALGEARSFGNLSLQLFDNGLARPSLFRSAELLADARVSIEQPGGAAQPCTREGSAHRCAGGVEIETQWHEIDYAPRRCARVPPPGGAGRTVVELRAPRAAPALELVSGYIWDRGHFRSGVTSVTVGVEVDGAVTTVELPAGEFRLQRTALPGVREGAPLRLWTQSSNAHDRDVCVELSGLGGVP